MACYRALLVIASLLVSVEGSALHTASCPSTTFQFQLGGVWLPQEPMQLPIGQCVAACPAGKAGKIEAVRMCGPGTFSLSRMSCARHGHKAVTIEHPANQFTASTCREYSTANWYQIDGSIGSITVTCAPGAR